MTLRTRLWVGLAAIVAAIVAVGLVTGALYRSSLNRQLDDRLDVYAGVAPGVQARLNGAGGAVPPGARPGGPPIELSEVYIGVVQSGDSHRPVTTLLAPSAEPNVRPILPLGMDVGQHRTIKAVGGTSPRMRAVMVDAIDGDASRPIVVALSTADIEDSFARLRNRAAVAGLVLAAVLALVGSWVVRLGLRPLKRMTVVADAITAGCTDVRAPEFPAHTEAAHLSAALNTMIDANQATEARLRRFVADASHELRTPLTTLRGYATLYQSGGLTTDDAVADAMRRMKGEAERMAGLVDDLLVLAELDEERPLVLEPVDLHALASDVCANARAQQPDRSIALALSASAPVVDGDKAKLMQAFTALVANALQHTPRSAAVTIAVSQDDEQVTVLVADQGPGIAPEHLPHLFERFYRADAGRARKAGGSGLGLSIVASIIEAHGGEIRVTSDVGAGAAFHVSLPISTR